MDIRKIERKNYLHLKNLDSGHSLIITSGVLGNERQVAIELYSDNNVNGFGLENAEDVDALIEALKKAKLIFDK